MTARRKQRETWSQLLVLQESEWLARPQFITLGASGLVTCVHQSIFIYHMSPSQADKQCQLDLAFPSKASTDLKVPSHSTTVIYLPFFFFLSFFSSSLLIYKYWLTRQAGRNERKQHLSCRTCGSFVKRQLRTSFSGWARLGRTTPYLLWGRGTLLTSRLI